ncbi:MAG: glucoamylase family protein [Candidatus Ozemobacteraceae bacterium]
MSRNPFSNPLSGWCLSLGIFLCLLFAGAPVWSADGLTLGKCSSSDQLLLDLIQKRAFTYFVEASNPENGLVLDRADNHRPASLDYCPSTIAGTGFGLAALCVGAERGWMSRSEVRTRIWRTLRFFLTGMPNVHGFFYHFIDARTGQRVWNCEVSSVDTGLFLAGVVAAAGYFRDDKDIVRLANRLLDRVDWRWMTAGGPFLRMGWTPENGFIEADWSHYSESLFMYLLAMGSDRHGINATGWRKMRRTIGEYGGQVFIGFPALFTHQFSHIWVDFRNRADEFADYFENSRRATLANRQFCLDLRRAYTTFDEDRWGLTACIGPDGYSAYGAPPGLAIVDGTVAPAAAGCSIMFTPELSIRALRHLYERFGERLFGRFGFTDAYNFDRNFIATDVYAINQGPLLLAIENFRTGKVWDWFMDNPRIQKGLRKADLIEGRRPPDIDPASIVKTHPYLPYERPEYRSTPISGILVPRLMHADAPAWKGMPAIILDAGFLQQGYGPDPSFRTTVQAAHTRDLLLVRFQTHDPDRANPFPDEQMFRGDMTDLYLDGRNDGMKWRGDDDLQIVMAPRRDGSGLRAREFFHTASTTSAIVVHGTSDRSGYSGVLVLQRATLGLTGNRIGFSPTAHDIVDKPGKVARDVRYAWHFAEPGITLGTLILEESLCNR